MSTIKLTKNELRNQQDRLTQLERYLPTLQLKKALLQTEVNHAESEIEQFTRRFHDKQGRILEYAHLFSDRGMRDFFENLSIDEVVCESENIAGVEVPIFKSVKFTAFNYPLYDTPFWWDTALRKSQEMVTEKQKVFVAERKKALLQKELREVSIRVNLFEKILIPRTQANIKKIGFGTIVLITERG